MAVLAVLLYELGQVNEAWGVVISAPGRSCRTELLPG